MTLYADVAYDYNGYSIVVLRDKPRGKVMSVQVFLDGSELASFDDEQEARREVDRLIEQANTPRRTRLRL